MQLLARHGVQFAEARSDAAGAISGQLDARLKPAASAWVDQVRAAVDGAADFAELEQKLLAMTPDMGLDDYATTFAQAMTVAHLTGRYDLIRD